MSDDPDPDTFRFCISCGRKAETGASSCADCGHSLLKTSVAAGVLEQPSGSTADSSKRSHWRGGVASILVIAVLVVAAGVVFGIPQVRNHTPGVKNWFSSSSPGTGGNLPNTWVDTLGCKFGNFHCVGLLQWTQNGDSISGTVIESPGNCNGDSYRGQPMKTYEINGTISGSSIKFTSSAGADVSGTIRQQALNINNAKSLGSYFFQATDPTTFVPVTPSQGQSALGC